MEKLTITKKINFSMAHMLKPKAAFGKCGNIHGHTYHLEVKISHNKVKNKFGMVMNFVDLKYILNKYVIEKLDHQFLVSEKTANSLPEDILSYLVSNGLILSKNEPTAENMIEEIANTLKEALKKNYFSDVKLESVRLYETPTSYAELNF